MILTAAVWAVGLAAGIALQRRVPHPQRLTHILFLATFWVTSPLMVFFAYTTLALDAGLLAAMTLVVASSWLVLALGFGAARLAGSGPAERGAMVLGAGLGNTGIVGFPLAAAVFGPPGLALAVVYSEFQFLIPVLAVSTGVARRFAGPGACAPGAPDLRTLLRSWVVNPPVAAGVLAVAAAPRRRGPARRPSSPSGRRRPWRSASSASSRSASPHPWSASRTLSPTSAARV